VVSERNLPYSLVAGVLTPYLAWLPPENLGAASGFLGLAYGPMVGVSAALCGRFLLRRNPPLWLPAVAALAAILVGVFEPGDSQYPVPAALTSLVAEIRRAELAYAAADRSPRTHVRGPNSPG
jgi:hypothetical protein